MACVARCRCTAGVAWVDRDRFDPGLVGSGGGCAGVYPLATVERGVDMARSKQPIRLTNEILLDGTLTCTGVAVALPGAIHRVTSVLVQADPNNAQDVFVGNENSQSVQLIPGATEAILIDQPNKIFIRADAGTQRVNWHAVGQV